ncbi:hypothetical protein GCM10010911_01320 [Paenibacillus nasutitermitis]|uniref:Uncharacterized protein n=1 Tax=Paenibacillus nasutitermitis TaxID=1652958 RepID=A0A916YJ91_9BACL|nr:hypothetical protein GCM10010911_01320 [Paenibacillus nasutitermitis]
MSSFPGFFIMEIYLTNYLNPGQLIRVSYGVDSGKLSASKLYKYSCHGFVRDNILFMDYGQVYLSYLL